MHSLNKDNVVQNYVEVIVFLINDTKVYTLSER